MVLLSELLFNQIAGRLIYRSTVDVDFVFVKTTDGALLWEKIDAGASPENMAPGYSIWGYMDRGRRGW